MLPGKPPGILNLNEIKEGSVRRPSGAPIRYRLGRQRPFQKPSGAPGCLSRGRLGRQEAQNVGLPTLLTKQDILPAVQANISVSTDSSSEKRWVCAGGWSSKTAGNGTPGLPELTSRDTACGGDCRRPADRLDRQNQKEFKKE